MHRCVFICAWTTYTHIWVQKHAILTLYALNDTCDTRRIYPCGKEEVAAKFRLKSFSFNELEICDENYSKIQEIHCSGKQSTHQFYIIKLVQAGEKISYSTWEGRSGWLSRFWCQTPKHCAAAFCNVSGNTVGAIGVILKILWLLCKVLGYLNYCIWSKR